MADLRSFVYLDAMQPQVAAYIGTVARGFLPLAYEASLIVEISPGIEINRITDVAVKATDVRPGMQVVERLYGMLEVHSREQAQVRQAGAAILAALSLNESDRIKPRVLSSQVIRRVDALQAQLINRDRQGMMLVAGESLYILEVEPAARARRPVRSARGRPDRDRCRRPSHRRYVVRADRRALGLLGEAGFDLWPAFRALDGIPSLVVHGELSDVLSAESVAKV